MAEMAMMWASTAVRNRGDVARALVGLTAAMRAPMTTDQSAIHGQRSSRHETNTTTVRSKAHGTRRGGRRNTAPRIDGSISSSAAALASSYAYEHTHERLCRVHTEAH
jgi:hypothetical protein